MSMIIVTPQQMDAVLAVTDSMSIHREAVVVPLGPEGQGNIRVANDKLEVTVPEEDDFNTWNVAKLLAEPYNSPQPLL